MIQATPFELTDEQWEAVSRHMVLKDEMRAALDGIASTYLVFEEASRARRPNSDVKRDLLQIANAAEKLAHLLRDSLNSDVVMRLVDPARLGDTAGPMPRMDGLRRLNEHVASVSTLETWCRDVAKEVPRQSPGRDTGNLDWLVEQAARCFEHHSGARFKEQSGRRKYVSAFVAAVDPERGDDSINHSVDVASARP